MKSRPRIAVRANGIPRIALAVAALQLVAALAAAGHDARAGAFVNTTAAGDGPRAAVESVPTPQRGGRSGRRRAPDALLPGTWGGQHVRFEVTERGATVEFDCAHATVEGPVVVDRAGRFVAAGTYYAEHGGPVRADETPSGFPVRLTGRVGGSLMKLTVTRARARRPLGTFALARDREAELFKCR